MADSGVGGLTVLNRLQKDFPRCNYLYLADSAHCPYGTKSGEQIFRRIQRLVEWFAAHGAGAVVLACNTASVFAPELRQRFSLPIFDVIEPTCKLAASLSEGRIALLATDATVKSGAYQRRLRELGATVAAFACSELVPFAEHGEQSTPQCQAAVRAALKNLDAFRADTVILGCTHFPLLRQVIAPYVGKARMVECVTDFVPPPECLARRGKTAYFTTGKANQKRLDGFAAKAKFVHLDV